MSERGERFLTPTDRVWRDQVRSFPFAPGVPGVHVGASVLQTPGAIRSEMEKIEGEIMSTDAELEAQARQHGLIVEKVMPFRVIEQYDGKDPIARFYVDVWIPFRRSWHDWYHDNKPPTFLSRPLSWLGSLAWNDAPTAEAFQRNLIGLRQTAKKIGYTIHSAEPDVEGMSLADPRRPGVGDAVDELAHVVKLALYGALGIGAAIGVVEVVRIARSK